jgi:hypothetical protein
VYMNAAQAQTTIHRRAIQPQHPIIYNDHIRLFRFEPLGNDNELSMGNIWEEWNVA